MNMSDKPIDRDNANEDELHKVNNNENERLRRSDTAAEQEETNDEAESAASTTADDLSKLRKDLEESQQLAGSYKDQLLRLAAEFENFRKRTETDKADFVKFSSERIIRELLPVLDDFERALSNGKKNPDFDSFFKGVEMIYQKFRKVFEDKGLKPIDSVGKEFDVTYHDVLMQVERPDVPPHTVVEEVERGYTLHGKVIKHAKVIVASDNRDDKETAETN
jgi:molecular chaperone GrpE